MSRPLLFIVLVSLVASLRVYVSSSPIRETKQGDKDGYPINASSKDTDGHGMAQFTDNIGSYHRSGLLDWSSSNYSWQYAKQSLVHWNGKPYDPLTFKGGEINTFGKCAVSQILGYLFKLTISSNCFSFEHGSRVKSLLLYD
jgi:hypothetical protein